MRINIGRDRNMEVKMHAAVSPILSMMKIEMKILVKNVLIDRI